MYSPRSHLESIISSYLGSYVEDYDSTYLSVSIINLSLYHITLLYFLCKYIYSSLIILYSLEYLKGIYALKIW